MTKSEKVARRNPKEICAQNRKSGLTKHNECTARLCRRREALSAAGKNACKANAAVARELACWVWEIGCRAEGTLG